MSLTPKVKQELKGKAHKLKPIVLIGNNGLSESVIKEVNRALTDHELIKVRIQAEDRDARKALFAELCESNQANPIQLIGNIAIIYRKRPD